MRFEEDDAHTTMNLALRKKFKHPCTFCLPCTQALVCHRTNVAVFDQILDQVDDDDDDKESQAEDTKEPPIKQRLGPGKKEKWIVNTTQPMLHFNRWMIPTLAQGFHSSPLHTPLPFLPLHKWRVPKNAVMQVDRSWTQLWQAFEGRLHIEARLIHRMTSICAIVQHLFTDSKQLVCCWLHSYGSGST